MYKQVNEQCFVADNYAIGQLRAYQKPFSNLKNDCILTQFKATYVYIILTNH